MPLEKLLREKREEILDLAARHGAYNVRIFGSVARGDADEKNYVDILVELEDARNFFDPGELLIDLEDLLRPKVDVVTVRRLKQSLGDQWTRETVSL